MKDEAAVRSFFDFDAMLARFEDGVLLDSLEYRQHDEQGERWMELDFRLVRLEAVSYTHLGWGYVKPMEEADAATDFEKAGTRIARRCRLSPREIEVLFLLAKGRNLSLIHI